MKISYNWLKSYVNIPWDVEETGDKLTDTGLEVEGIEPFESIPGGLEGVVVGEVLEVEKHPNADRLRLCKVNVGNGEPLSIVCGAPNVAQGQKVPVATVGAKLYPAEGDPFEIKKGKIRGEVSMGMICAEDELGLGNDHDGIMVLDAGLDPGTPAAEVFGIERDQVFEIGLTANRADATSHFGVARDLAAVQRVKASFPELKTTSGTFKSPISVNIEHPEKCARYVGIYIKGITVKPSPEWMQNRLKAIGLRPINNIVDITNFVLHELGQPLHAFDADLVRGGQIIVKTLGKDQTFKTLDDTERKILGDRDLMICDAEGPVAVAGVMGGLNSEVSDSTSNIFLESAWFDPISVRKTGKALGLKTDASYRFERGVDPEITLKAAQRAADLIIELAGGEASEAVDVVERKFEPYRIDFDLEKANAMMGHAFSVEEMVGILDALDIVVHPGSGAHHFSLEVPRYRVDVTRPQDVMEEILRIYGYNNIAFDSKAGISFSMNEYLDPWKIRNRYFDYLAANGWFEIMTGSLVHRKHEADHTVNVINNLSEEMAVMRDNMLITGLDVIEFNQNRKQSDLKLAEFGRIYWQEEDGQKEKEQIALYITGNRQQAGWRSKALASDLYSLTAEMEKLQQWFGFEGKLEELEENRFWEFGLALTYKKKVIARWGSIKAEWLEGRDIRTEVLFGLIEWETLFDAMKQKDFKFKEIPKFPGTDRDVSMLVPEDLGYAAIKKAILACNPALIKEITITDVYKGDKIEAGKKSYLVHLHIRDDKKTLVDKSVDKLMARVFNVLEKDLGAEVRK